MASDFVERTLGPWSSHPEQLRRQKKLLLFLGILPVIAVALLCVLVYNDLFSWKAFTEQIGLLICSAFFALGFLLTLIVLYLASFTIGSRQGQITGKDDLVFPPWLVIGFCFFWLLPYLLSVLPDVPLLKKLAERYPTYTFLKFDFTLELKAVLNMLAISPFLCLLTWVLCAREYELKDNEKLVRRPVVLTLALLCLGLLGASFFIPKYRLCMWIVLPPITLILFSLWWFWRKKVVFEKKTEPKAKEAAGEEEDAIPEQAAYIIERLKDVAGIQYEEDGKEQQLAVFSPRIQENEKTFPLIALMNGKVPTEDQAEFLDRFGRFYEETLADFIENASPNSEQTLPDLILQGPEGSGRTEALCAAAVYAAVVRGQNVLYIVQDSPYSSSLAEKMKSRLRDLGVDCYYTADDLNPNLVESWLLKEKKGQDKENQVELPRDLPPNILFTTPERVEQFFFSNSNLKNADKREALRNIMLGYSVILVDDFLEMPIPLQAHLVFILDKFRLLQASEYVMGQFVVATTPLQDPYGIDSLARRLFGLSWFNKNKNAAENVVMLRPRQCDPFWCGTLRITPGEFAEAERELALEKAVALLLDICTERKYNTLLYSKEIGKEEAETLEKTYKKKGGEVSVSSHLYQLNVEKMPFDTIFHLSLTGKNAAAALRLSLPDDKAGTPVFFRIALHNETEQAETNQFSLLPDETAVSLRAWHLRSVLPFLPRLTPIPASIWSRFGVSPAHPFCREGKIEQSPGGVKWYYDYYTEPNRYGNNVIWPYLVLASEAAISNAGESVNFNILPNTKDSIFWDSLSTGPRGEVLCFVSEQPKETDSDVASQLAVWRDENNTEMDLAHADQLALITANSQFSVDKITPVSKRTQAAASRYAMILEPTMRRGLSSYDVPIRHFSWYLPSGGFQVQGFQNYQGERACFSLCFENSFTRAVSAEISGEMNPVGRIRTHAVYKYGYDAYMSALVFLPESDCDETSIRRFLPGEWSTDPARGFSSPLTHAFSIALRNQIAGLSFFAMTPVFLTAEYNGSFGSLLLWFLEPFNSGNTAFKLVNRLMEDQNVKFKRGLLEDIRSILKPDDAYVSLDELRIQSQMAFTGENDLSPEQWESQIKRGLHVVDLLLDSDALKLDIADRAKRRKEHDERRKEELKKRQEEFLDPSLVSEEDRKRYKEFASVATSALMAFRDVIDVSRFCRDYGWSPEKILDVFEDFLWNSPEIFFVAKSCRTKWSYEPDGTITSCVITDLIYGIRKEEYATAKDELERAADKAMRLLEGVSDPVKKALILHDHIVRICEYDCEARDKKDLSPRARTAYSVLVRNKAVCEGYAMGYRYLLNRAGIRSEEVDSDEMNHCWNYLCLDGRWYHVDVTWDDPVYNGRKPDPNVISHEYFLLSDAKIRSKKHPSWSVRGLPEASDTRFDDKDWDSY